MLKHFQWLALYIPNLPTSTLFWNPERMSTKHLQKKTISWRNKTTGQDQHDRYYQESEKSSGGAIEGR